MRIPAACCSLTIVLAACGGTHRAPPAAAGLAAAEAETIFVAPPDARVEPGAVARFAIRSGDDPLGHALAAWAESCEPCCARVATWQQNLLVPSVAGGGLGIDVVFGDGGGAVVGFASTGRVARWRSAGGDVVTALVRQQAKCIVAVGDAAEGGGAPLRRLGLDSELTPLVDPTWLGPGDPLPLRLRSELGSTRGVRVRMLVREDGAAAARDAGGGETDGQGNVELHLPVRGTYLLHGSVVSPREPWQVHVCTLTFRNGGRP